jgi:hypothetical protein
MKFIKHTKQAVILRCEKESWHDSFAFDLSIIPADKPYSKNLIIESERGAKRWSMPWEKFLKQECVGNVVIIPKEALELKKSPRHN